jgi:xanthine dehydrogenase molybdenum-binding subunit
MGKELTVIGKSVAQKDGIERVTGEAKYFGDVMLPHMLHCKILRSRYAQADVLRIATTKAEALPGVKLVMTYQNFPTVLKRDVHFVGDQVAAVIATDEETAEEALDLIKVEYEQKPFVLDIAEAMKPDAPRVFPDRSNIRAGWGPGLKWYYFSEKDPITGLWTKKEESDFHGFGDVEKGFSKADIIVEDGDISQAYSRVTTMEPRGCIALFEGGRLTVWTHTQGLHHTKNDIAKFFDLPLNKVNVVSPFTGGSFGGKSETFYIPIAATLVVHKPVRLVYSREEEMLCGWARGSLSRAKLGFKKDGTLTTMEIEHWVEIGPNGDAYPVRNVYRHSGAMLYARNCKHLKIKAGVVFTNRFVSRGWQGYGCPESNFLIETLMDEAAYALGIDPVELRRKNHFIKGSPVASARQVHVNTQIASCGLQECLDRGVERSEWHKKWKHPKVKEGPVRKGLGIALSIHGAGDGLPSTAIVKVLPDATVLFACSIADIGQGQHTVQCQIVSEVLGIPYENVHIVCHDTDSAPFAVKVAGSQGTWHQGWATYEAALDAKKQILRHAGQKLGVDPEALYIKDARIYVQGAPDKSCDFAEAFGEISMIIGTGKSFPAGSEQGIYPREQGAHFAELKVDTDTGEITVVNYIPAQYVGRALNPKIVEGQIGGQIFHGLESAFLGECITDPQTGKMLTYNWENYKPMTLLDFDMKHTVMVEIPDRDNSHPFGAVACGEGTINPVCAVCGNSIFNALGIRFKSTPFTPDKILRALGKI